MNCPRCGTSVSLQQSSCSACGFSATTLQSFLGNQWVRLERVTDALHCLRLEELRRVESILDDFERSFSQAFFVAYLGVLPSNLNIQELGFWLLNQGAFNTPSVQKRNDFGIVFLVDPGTQTAGISLGYSIEGLIKGNALASILRATADYLGKGAFGAAIETACKRCRQELQKTATSTPWEPDLIARTGSASDLGFHPLRGGHTVRVRPHPEQSNSLL